MRAIADCACTPLLPGYNTEALERTLHIPIQKNPKYCMQDERWLTARKEQMAEQSVNAISQSGLLRGDLRAVP